MLKSVLCYHLADMKEIEKLKVKLNNARKQVSFSFLYFVFVL